jgi:hypothetical protein
MNPPPGGSSKYSSPPSVNMSQDSHGSLVRGEKQTQEPRRTRRGTTIAIGAGVALVVVLALALGLGLGLGLKKHHSSSSSGDTSGNSTSPSSLPPLVTTPPENFVLGTIAGQSPQTRTYNFTVSQVQGAPDGVSKRMLAVNGTMSELCFKA